MNNIKLKKENQKIVNLTKRVYSVVGTNLFFETRESILKFLHKMWKIEDPTAKDINEFRKKWGTTGKELPIKEHLSHSRMSIKNPGRILEDGYDLIEHWYNDNHATVAEYLLISEDDQIERCMDIPSVKNCSFYQELNSKKS